MPAVASTMPLDDGSRFTKWKDQLVPSVLGAYGTMLGLNFFFIMMPVIREASQLFTDADLQTNLAAGNWLAGVSSTVVNQIVYMLFLLVALTLIQELPGVINTLVGGKDYYAEGKNVKDNVPTFE